MYRVDQVLHSNYQNVTVLAGPLSGPTGTMPVVAPRSSAILSHLGVVRLFLYVQYTRDSQLFKDQCDPTKEGVLNLTEHSRNTVTSITFPSNILSVVRQLSPNLLGVGTPTLPALVTRISHRSLPGHRGITQYRLHKTSGRSDYIYFVTTQA
jgi:hypothetical protein